MLVDLEPVGMNRRTLTLSRRERKRIPFVDSDRFRHFVIPSSDVRTYEIEDALQWGYQNPRDVISRVDTQLPGRFIYQFRSRFLRHRDPPVRQKLFWRDGSLHESCMWITAHDDVRYTVSILRFIVPVL